MAYTEESMDEVSLDLTEILVFDHQKGMFFMLGSHQDSEPRLLCEPNTNTHTRLMSVKYQPSYLQSGCPLFFNTDFPGPKIKP